MVKFIITCLFYTTIARWGYSEIAMMFPSALPYLNQAIHKLQIPTHDTWSRASIEDYVDEAKYALLEAKDSFEELKESIREVRQS